jgi:hypothetical protein
LVMAEPATKLFSTCDVARALRVSSARVVAMRKAGRLEVIATTLRGRPLFSCETVEAEAVRRRMKNL